MAKPSNAAILAAISETLTQQNAAMTREFARINERLMILESARQNPNNATNETALTASVRTGRAPSKTRRAASRKGTTVQATEKFPKATEQTVAGTVVRLARGGYGALIATDSGNVWINAPSYGLPFTYAAGADISVSVDKFGRVSDLVGQKAPRKARNAAKRQNSAAVAAPSTPAASKSRETAPRTTTRASNGTCPVCNGNKHNNYGADEITDRCLQQQYLNETGRRYSDDFLAYAQWRVAAPRKVFAKNATGVRIVNGDVAPASAPLATPTPTKRTMVRCINDKCVNAARNESGRCNACEQKVADAESKAVAKARKLSDKQRETHPTAPPSRQPMDPKVKAARKAARREKLARAS